MNRRDFIIQMGTALIAVPFALSLESCGGDNGDDAAPNPVTGFDVTSSTDVGHNHSVRIISADLTNPASAGVVYTSTVSAGHAHTISVSQQQLMDIDKGSTVNVISSLNDGHTHTWSIKKP